MATRFGGGSRLVNNLGKIYGLYTAGFIAFAIMLAILEQIGVPERVVGFLIIAATLAAYAVIGILTRTMQVPEFYVAGHQVPAVYNGMATAAGSISTAVFLAMAGSLYLLGYDGLAFILGGTGGYVLLALLIAPQLRASGAYTVPAFFTARFGVIAGFLGVVILVTVSFLYLVAQIRGAGLIAERFLDMSYAHGVYLGVAAIVLCSVLGGMRAVTWTQVAQYIVLIIAYLLPITVLSLHRTGVPIPQLMYGEALRNISLLEQNMVTAGLAAAATLKAHAQPFAHIDPVNFIALVLCIMIGTASLPHVLMRSFTVPSPREARGAVGWGLVFVAILYVTVPAYAAFAKWDIYDTVIGARLAELPSWIYAWGAAGKVQLCGAAATSLEAVRLACAGKDVVGLADFSIASDMIVMATPEMAGLPFIVTGLVGAGALAAALSTADGLLLAMANSLSHDVHYRLIDRRAPTGRRLFIARLILIGLAIAGGYVALTATPDLLKLVALSFSLAAAGNFPALCLGIWWKRCTPSGAVAGMIAGFGTTLAYMIYTEPAPFGFGGPELATFLVDDATHGADAGIDNIAAGIFGVPIGFLVMFVVSKLTAARADDAATPTEASPPPGGDLATQEG